MVFVCVLMMHNAYVFHQSSWLKWDRVQLSFFRNWSHDRNGLWNIKRGIFSRVWHILIHSLKCKFNKIGRLVSGLPIEKKNEEQKKIIFKNRKLGWKKMHWSHSFVYLFMECVKKFIQESWKKKHQTSSFNAWNRHNMFIMYQNARNAQNITLDAILECAKRAKPCILCIVLRALHFNLGNRIDLWEQLFLIREFCCIRTKCQHALSFFPASSFEVWMNLAHKFTFNVYSAEGTATKFAS